MAVAHALEPLTWIPTTRPPDADDSEATRRAWEGLQRQFLARLPARAERIRLAVNADEALAEWHRLAGVAGSYGLPTLGELARRTLNACHGATGDAAGKASILAAALAEFDAALLRLASPSPPGVSADSVG
ncbi:MAG: hypothetical protein RIQ60_2012 [Pseudomonadota bacterium]|jgi:hypothetical protein